MSGELLKLFQSLITFCNFTKYCILKGKIVIRFIGNNVRWDFETISWNYFWQVQQAYLTIKMRGISQKYWEWRWSTIWISISTQKQNVLSHPLKHTYKKGLESLNLKQYNSSNFQKSHDNYPKLCIHMDLRIIWNWKQRSKMNQCLWSNSKTRIFRTLSSFMLKMVTWNRQRIIFLQE